MKANGVPEKIYILNHTDYSDRCILNAFTEKENNNDIEYIRKDAFIEKAETYLKEKFVKDVSVLAGGVVHINFETAINNFINYMKGD